MTNMELPEIEIMRRNLANKIINKKIICFNVLDLKVSRGNKDLFQQKINNSYFKDIKRYGDLLIFKLASGYYILINLYSRGNLIYTKEELKDKNIKAIFKFEDDSKMYFINSGQFGYLQILSDSEIKRLSVNFGLDPTSKDFSFLAFKKLFRNKTVDVKSFLMNKKLLAGIGTIYSDEICCEARVVPYKSVRFLEESEIKRLYSAIRKIFKKSIEYNRLNGDYSKFIYVYNRENKKCLKCGLGIVRKILLNDRKTFFCPVCQK